MTILTVQQLTKKFGGQTVVGPLDFTLQPKKCVAVIGPNGAGKTTTLRMLTGLMKPTSGTITFKNQKHGTDFRSLIGYLPQHPVFHQWMTGEEYLMYCARLTHLDKQDAKNKTENLLEKVGIIDAKNKRISTYSGGIKQRLGIAQAIIHKPKLLLLDEPVSALDPIGRREVLNLMEELKKETSILFSTHILSDADEISDALLLLHGGQIVESGAMDTLRKKYQTEKIELTFDGNPKAFADELHTLETVIAITTKHHTLHITVTNIADARQEILNMATEHHWPFTSFTINRASLENMFVKAVQS